MDKKISTMRGIVKGFANAMNLLQPEIHNHHQQVAYLSYNIAEKMGYDESDRLMIIYASLFHDAGLSILPETDEEGKKITYKFSEITEAGASIIGESPKFNFIRKVMLAGRFSDKMDDLSFAMADDMKKAFIFSQIICLANAVSEMIDYKRSALNQIPDICEEISEMAGNEISAEVIEAFLTLQDVEYMWMNLLHMPDAYLEYIPANRDVSLDETIEYSRIMSRVIDYRSSYTAMHSSGVVVPAVRLAELIGMSEEECKKIMIAGYLHDIGKLTIPKSILNKNDKLTDEEFNVVKEHAYYTYILLKDIPGFEQIRDWAGLHHEKLDGAGYPFGLKADDIPMGARIMAVADLFSAVAEIRPYRAGMSKEEVIKVLHDGALDGALSRYIVELMITNYDDIYEKRDIEVRNEGARYYAAVVNSDEE